jgi:hypothetical protein
MVIRDEVLERLKAGCEPDNGYLHVLRIAEMTATEPYDYDMVFAELRLAASKEMRFPNVPIMGNPSATELKRLRTFCDSVHIRSSEALRLGRSQSAVESYLLVLGCGYRLTSMTLLHFLLGFRIMSLTLTEIERHAHSFSSDELALIHNRIDEALNATNPMIAAMNTEIAEQPNYFLDFCQRAHTGLPNLVKVFLRQSKFQLPQPAFTFVKSLSERQLRELYPRLFPASGRPFYQIQHQLRKPESTWMSGPLDLEAIPLIVPGPDDLSEVEWMVVKRYLSYVGANEQDEVPEYIRRQCSVASMLFIRLRLTKGHLEVETHRRAIGVVPKTLDEVALTYREDPIVPKPYEYRSDASTGKFQIALRYESIDLSSG